MAGATTPGNVTLEIPGPIPLGAPWMTESAKQRSEGIVGDHFAGAFKELTRHEPFPWQERLYHDYFSKGATPTACAIPTGLGKTSVLAVWLIALASGASIPRRLVYVVNRRTVVDQTTREAEALKAAVDAGKLPGLDALAISTLRGQYADNREWSADPSRPAIICGTVDMIGSRLLFSGYGVGFKSKPLHAGFLGQDALLVHDEAHLEPAFEQLIETIQREQANERKQDGDLPWPMMRVMEMTATTRSDVVQTDEPCGLTDEEKNPPEQIPEPADNEPAIHHVWRRLKAKKTLSFTCVDDDKQAAGMIAQIAMAHKDANAAVLVFVPTLDAVTAIETELVKTKRKVVLLTGTMRGKERDELVEKPEFKRFLKGAEPGETVYLVCTSAGEVGIDISADHMVCDLSTFDSMAQRLGRVNRYGERTDTRIDVVRPASFGKIDKKSGELKADEIDKRRAKTLEVLGNLDQVGQDEDGKPIFDASPNALDKLPASERLAAFAPTPVILPATDILFDAWALTSIREKMPGRPPVAPYLHGVADDLPQTTIAWRAELDLIDARVPDAEKLVHAIFSKHRVRPHETLTAGMTKQRVKWQFRVVEFLEQAVAKRPDLREVFVAIRFPRGHRLKTVGELIDDSGILNAETMLILPASFGGLDEKGSLSVDAVPKTKPPQSQSGNEEAGEEATKQDADRLPASLDLADHDGYEPYEHEDVKPRIRVLIERSDDGWSARAMPGGKPLPGDWELEPTYEKSTELVNTIRRKSGLNVRLVQAIEKNEEGEDIRSLVCLSPAPKKVPQEEQSLAGHVGAVEKEAQRLAEALELTHPYRAALLFAAKWHDEGKKAAIWQRYIGGPDANGSPLGKSAKWCDPKKLVGYRHEFGTLLRIEHPDVLHTGCTLPEDEDIKELALHLIAAHHGNARPHFSYTFDRDFTTQQSDQTHTTAMRRFARLQRKYGRWGLAYLESLLRAADAAASAGLETDDDTEDLNGGDQ